MVETEALKALHYTWDAQASFVGLQEDHLDEGVLAQWEVGEEHWTSELVFVKIFGVAQEASLALVSEMAHLVGKHDEVYQLLVEDMVVEEQASDEECLQATVAPQMEKLVQCLVEVAYSQGRQTSDWVEEEVSTAVHGAEWLDAKVEVETMSC